MAQQSPQSPSQSKVKPKKISKNQAQRIASGRYHEDNDSRFAVTIEKPVDQVFNFFRNLENLPFFMKDLKKIEILSDKKSRWTVELGIGLSATWEAEIVAERENEMMAWQSVPEESEVDSSGAIWFSPAPLGRGCVVSLKMQYSLPGGKATEVATKLSAEDPETLILINLRRFKALMETGEVPTTLGQSSGRDEEEESTESAMKH